MLTDIDLDKCLKCSDCNTVCPVLTAYPAFPGPKHLGPELERLRREGLSCDSEWVEYCLGCHRCDLACPNQVNVSDLIATAKARHQKPLIRKLRDFWLARPALLGKLLAALPSLSNTVLELRLVRFAMSALMKIAPQRSFPAYVNKGIRPSRPSGGSTSVLFFPGCAIRYNQPDLGQAVVALLELNGLPASVSDAGCCGLPALANGDQAEARARARDMVTALAKAAADGLSIVTACTSCGHMLKTGLAGLVSDDPQLAVKAEKIAQQVYDLGELLMARIDRQELKTAVAAQPLRLAYHAPCHQLSPGIGRPWYHLLRQIPGIEIEDLDAGCCGMSGTFGFKGEKYAVSMAAGQRLFEAIRESGAQMVISECATCRMQIEHATGLASLHPAKVMLEATGESRKAEVVGRE
jgi:glycerol-3-phosphate dehydrogenase subunit C